MRVSVMVVAKDELSVSGWYAESPEAVLTALQSQLDAAAVIWPELSQFRINKAKSNIRAIGAKGGRARAAALTPEQRSEIATKAAEARWGRTDTETNPTGPAMPNGDT